MSYLIRGGTLVDPATGRSTRGDLLIVGDRITAVGRAVPAGEAEVVDAKGLAVCPGLIDMHVHLREPGFEDKETIASGTAAAAAGGFSTVCAEPNTAPPIDSPELIADAMSRAECAALVRVHSKACLTKTQRGEEPTAAKALKSAGAIALSDDGEPVLDDSVMAACLRGAAAARMLVTTHCEESPASRGVKPWIVPYAAEPRLVGRDLGLLGDIPARLHFSHLSTAESVAAVTKARDSGLKVTAEATPHHCLLSSEQIPDSEANFKVNPPLRSSDDAAAIGTAVALGEIDVIASDHAPHTPAEKARGWDDAPFGVIGLETTLAVMLTSFYHPQLMSLVDLLAKMTWNPARILRLKSGKLSVGAPADVALIDLDREWVIDPREFKSKARNCPFAGWRVKGRAVGLFVGGSLVMKDGEMLGAAVGERT
ncbi:MAG: dihydroorotase [Armatimonadota bacterium]|nr:MAG: dihydroorotase [Armatimonadota bacterium]